MWASDATAAAGEDAGNPAANDITIGNGPGVVCASDAAVLDTPVANDITIGNGCGVILASDAAGDIPVRNDITIGNTTTRTKITY